MTTISGAKVPCNLGGEKHYYKLKPSPWNFLVFKCEWCQKFYYVPKVIFYKQMMAMGVFRTKAQGGEVRFSYAKRNTGIFEAAESFVDAVKKALHVKR